VARKSATEVLQLAGRSVTITNPQKVLFPQPKYTKLDVARYYVAVAEGALRGAGGRPNMLVRYPNGIDGEFFYQKRAPESRPDWIDVVELKFPSGRTALEIVPRDAAALAWMANLGCLELHPHPVRAEDLEHPDELRVDLDPVPGVKWSQVREVAMVAKAALADVGLVGWPKTSGKRGLHIYVRIERRWTFDEVRRAALARARDFERRRSRRASGGRKSVRAFSSTTTRTRRTAPSPPPIRYARRRRRRCRRRSIGKRCPTASRKTLRSKTCRAATSASATGTPASTSAPDRSRHCSAYSQAKVSATRPGRRTIGSRRASRRACSRQSGASSR
jgi:DNA ligase D-like protein (predicted polymerase)